MEQYTKKTSLKPYISKSFIESVFDEIRVEDIIKDFVKLERAGSNYKGKSPFIDEKTPSFFVNPAKQIWKDFSSGKGGNNAVSFLIDKGYSFVESVEYITNKLGKTIEYENTREAKAYQEKIVKLNELRSVLKLGIESYKKGFNKLPDNHPAKLEVFEHRKYNQDIIDTYQIGFAPGKRVIYDILKNKGQVDLGIDVSLLNKDNDFYYNRVVYPIFDAYGDPVGIAGRELKEEPKIKWLNSRTTELYNKDSIWYGLHLAKYEIRKTSTVYVMEGYNDVIAFQTNGILNAVAPCGTSIHDNQINILKKYADVVCFAMDGDKAGKASVFKNIPRFIEAGFRCEVIVFKGCDPDDFVRLHNELINNEGLEAALNLEAERIEGFKFLLSQLEGEGEVSQSIITKNLCELISKIKDDSVIEIYKKWLEKESSVGITVIKKWIKEFKELKDKELKSKYVQDYEYELPKGVEMTDEILNDVKRYQIFQANNQIYTQINTNEPPYRFRSCSNFSIFIIQHMSDESFPKKLVSVQNVFKQGFVFDVPSDTFNASSMFQKAMTNFGNFRWHGRADDLVRLQALLFDKMGTGRSIDMLGWQNEGFFLFNNLVVDPAGDDMEIDKNGCFQFKGVSYYVPSANVIYNNNPHKYQPQKNFKHIPGSVSEYDFFNKMYRVYGNHAISSIYFAIACLFHDIVAKHLKGFPINFSYGPPSTGKDQLNYAIKSLWGIPQVATNLEGGNSTATASLRELAQFNNSLMEWSEYFRGDGKLEGTLKSLWDLRGKKVGNIESKIATDNTPVLCGVSLTGNEYPDQAATISRLIWNDMNQTEFSEEDEREFNELNDIVDGGITHITIKIIKQRKLVEENFIKEYRMFMDVYQQRLPNCNKRMLKNISTLTAFYEILKDVINFPFDANTIVSHFVKITENQMRKLTSSSVITRWWDCFLASMRGTLSDQILVGRDLKLEGSLLYFQFTNCYSKVQRQWFSQYRDSAPAKTTMKEAIEKDQCYADYKKVVDFNSGGPRVQSSALVVDIMKLQGDLPDLIKAEVKRQEYEKHLKPSAIQSGSETKENNSESDKKLTAF